MRITFFKTGRPKSFNYTPRYYDEQKEEFEKRQKRIEQELGIEENKAAFNSQLNRGVMREKLNARRTSRKGSVIRLIIIITILTMMVLYLLRDTASLSHIFK